MYSKNCLYFVRWIILKLVPYEQKYHSYVVKLLGETDYYLLWGDKSINTILAIDDNNIIGVGALWTNKLHPYREYIGIYISKNSRNLGVAYSIYTKLLDISKTKQFQTAISSKNNSAIHLLNKCNFKIARRCFTPVLTKEIKMVGSEEILQKDIVSLRDCPSSLQKRVVSMHYENYKLFHKAINPLDSNVSIDQWEQRIFNEVDEENTFLLVRDNELEAYLICYNEGNGEISIGYIGGKSVKKVKEYVPFYKNTILKLIHQFETVTIEADDIDIFAFAALNEFFYDQTESWDTYIVNG